MIRSLVPALALALSFGATAHADSFKTEPTSGSKRAAKVGPTPYVGATFSTKQAMKIVRNGAKLMRQTKNAAIRMDTIRVVDSATMDSTEARRAFAKRLATLAKSGNPANKFARGYNLLMRTGGRGALKWVADAAKALPNDSAVQLGAFQAFADFSMGNGLRRGEAVKLRWQAGKFYKQALAIEKAHPRPLVAKNLAETKAYLTYYPEMTRYLK